MCARAVESGFDPGGSAQDHPERIAHYRILRRIGQGSMGVVYEAEQAELKRRVALKVLSPVIANDAEAVARFSREAQAAARLEHPRIAAVHEMGRDGAFLYYSMELVEGPSLHDWIIAQREGRALPGLDVPERERWTWLARLFAEAATGLHAAHEMEVVHRDIKPSNILVAPDGGPKVVDFGLARIGGAGETLTSPGTLLGTLHYMSPEQAKALHAEIDRRSDVYSLGATLYEALTLQPPFPSDDPVELLSHILTDEPVAPRRRRSDIPKDLETIALHAMAKQPRERYPSAQSMAEDLQRFLRAEAIQAKRPGPLTRLRARLRRGPLRAAVPTAALLLVAFLVFVLAGGLGPRRVGPEIAEGMTLRTYSPGAAADLVADGIAPHSSVVDWLRFLLPDRGMGTIVATHTPQAQLGRTDLCAFGTERELLWTARGSWEDFEQVFGTVRSVLAGMRCVVTRPARPDPEESLLVSVLHPGRAWLLILDPVTGRRRGTWIAPPEYVPEAIDLGTLGMIPEFGDRPRRLIIGHSKRREDGSRAPCVVLLETDGRFVASYELPVLGFRNGSDLKIELLMCNWSLDQPEIELLTSEQLLFAFLVEDGLLDVASVRASVGDLAERFYDEHFGEGEFEKMVEEKGDGLGLLDDLVKRIRVVEGPR